jgi:hypothetical protein
MKENNNQLLKIPIKDLAKKIICEGDLYLTFKDGRQVYLMRPGLILEEEFLKKHASLGTVFDYAPVTDQEVIDKFVSLFRELKYLQFEKDLRAKSQEIAQYFHDQMAGGNHFLCFALACYQEFCALPAEAINMTNQADVYLFRKCLYAASFSVIIALANDFFHYLMIKDLFNITFSLDIGLCSSSYTYYVAQACNYENQHPGQGKNWLEEKGASEAEVELFYLHPEKSHIYLKTLHHLLAYPELVEIVLYQHELADGTGFPRGVVKGHVSNWEAVVILADSLVDITDKYTFEKDTVNYLLNFKNSKLTELPVGKAYKKLCMVLRHFDQLRETGS